MKAELASRRDEGALSSRVDCARHVSAQGARIINPPLFTLSAERMFVVLCDRCGYEFYRGEKPPNLYRIYVVFGGRCPRCGREVKWVPTSIEVRRKIPDRKV